MKIEVNSMNCCKCGRFIGPDGYPDTFPDDYSGGYETGYPMCGPCGRQAGKPDKRKTDVSDLAPSHCSAMPPFYEQSPGIWVCRHPQWLESSQYATWLGCGSDSPMPPDVTWTAIEYCPICGETRQRLIPPNKES